MALTPHLDALVGLRYDRVEKARTAVEADARYVESPGFELNDAGRIAGVDAHYVSANVTYRESNPGPVFRQWSVNLESPSRRVVDRRLAWGRYARE